MKKVDVCVVGLGYIGLPTAAVFADRGLYVHGVDVNQRTVEAINSGSVPFVEPSLGEYVERAVRAGHLVASDQPVPAKTFIVAVPTPFSGDNAADLSYVEAAAATLAHQLSGDELIILESTSPPGATSFMAETILNERPELRDAYLKFAHCPERVLPGRVVVELVENDRIIGGLTPQAAEAARELYGTFCEGEILITDATTAEMAKLVENSFRDVNIAFANELSIICERLGIDVWELIDLANHHPRVNILQPGPGVGGHCIAIDPWFIVSAAPDEARLIRMARHVNESKPRHIIDTIEKVAARLSTPKVAMLGLAFKPNIDDLRESPALNITTEVALKHADWNILAVEPNITELPTALGVLPNVRLTETAEAVAEADVVVVLVDHTPFKEIPAHHVAGKRVVDTRGMWRGMIE